MRLGADAEQLDALQGLDQLVLVHGAVVGFDLDACAVEDLVGAGVEGLK